MSLIQILFFFLTTLYFIMMVYFIYGWIREKRYSPQQGPFSTVVSIIIPVRNEEENISNLLQDLSFQNYPKALFEIIVVDDGSEDTTVERVERIQSEMGNLGLIKSGGKFSGKKNAIFSGINQSKGELIITTDADCSMAKSWLPSLVSYYEEKKPEMIIAPVAFHNEKTMFEKIQSLEFLSLSGITGASGLRGQPIMCNGANLAFTKKGFFEAGGYAGNEQIPSGDDVLLMVKFKKKFPGKINYLKSEKSIVHTQAQKTVSGFFNQRKRWVSKSPFYNDFFVSAISFLILLFNFSVLALLVLAAIYKGFGEILMVSLGVKFFIDFLFLFLAASFFSRKSLLWLYLPVQIMYIFYIPIISISGLTGNFTWKGREFKRK